MTDQSDILGNEVATQLATTTADQTAVNSNPYADKLSAIRNDEGLQKYASVDDALTSAVHAQEFIKTLKDEKSNLTEELADYKAQLAKRLSVEDAVSEIASTNAARVTPGAGLSREEVFSLMEERDGMTTRQSSRKSVVDTLVNHCGGDSSKAAVMIKNRLAELGMSKDHLATLSETAPSAVFELFGINGKGTSTPRKLESTIRTDAVAMSNGNGIPQPKRLPIGAGDAELVAEWRNSVAQANKNLGI